MPEQVAGPRPLQPVAPTFSSPPDLAAVLDGLRSPDEQARGPRGGPLLTC
jgi:hypothetical protein